MAAGTVLQDRQYNNWLRGTLSLQFMKEGLEDFINNETIHFHSRIFQSFEPALPVCNNSCKVEDIKKDSNDKWFMECQVCNSWLRKIMENEDPGGLCPQNCNPQLWPTVPWEVCKIYLPAGYSKCHSVKDADLEAILTLLQKCRHFTENSRISRQDLVSKMLQIRNGVLHASNCKVQDTDIQDYIRQMIEFLQGFRDLSESEDHHIQTAISRIKEIEAKKVQSSFGKRLKFTDLTEETQKPALKLTSLQDRLDSLKDTHGSQLRDIDSQLTSQKATLEKFKATQDVPAVKKLHDDTSLVEKEKSKMMQSIRAIRERIRALEEKKFKATQDTSDGVHAVKRPSEDTSLVDKQQSKKIKIIGTIEEDLREVQILPALEGKKKKAKYEVETQPSQEEMVKHDRKFILKPSPAPITPTSDQITDTYSGLILRSRMDTSIPRLKDETHLNWFRDSMGLHFLKEGLEDFVDKRVFDFHNNLHKVVPQPYSRHDPVSQAQSQQQTPSCVQIIQICKTCTNNDIVIHRGTWRVRCSSGICSEWLKLISEHVHQPWQNITRANLKPQLWPSHPWEVAKCFLPAGNENVTAARDTCVAGMLTLLNTCTYMHQFFKDHSLVEEVLCIRHRLMHSNTLSVSDNQLKCDTDNMIKLLTSLYNLSPQETSTVQRTIQEISELQSKTMDVTHSMEIMALKSGMQDVYRELTSLTNKCQDYEKTRHDQNKTAADLKRLEEDIKKLKTDINQSKGDSPVASSSVSWEDQCKDLQQILIGHYKNTCLEVPNPAENNDIGLEYIYVNPKSRVLRQSKGRDGLKNVKDEATSNSCRKIFYNDEYLSRQIYITGDAGSGKSFLCKNIVRLWCKAHGEFLLNEALDSDSDSDEESPMVYSFDKVEQRRQARKQRQQEKKDMREDDRQILSQFMFLFYITLRDSLSEYNVAEMIQSQILQYYNTGKDLHASALLKNKRCLVIVDGLDEWVCPAGAPVPHFVNPGLPGRDVANTNNVFLTTTRPWKLNILQLKSSEVDKHIELCAFDQMSASRFCSKVIKLRNESQLCKKEKQEFFEILAQKGLDHLKTIPVILVELMCIWFNNQELGKSQVQLYCGMLDLLLKKSQKNLIVQTSNTPSVASETPLPKCITEHPYCQDHQQLIYCLSRIAYEALFDKTKENSLVFKSSQLEIYGVGQESIDLCLKSGILSVNTVLEKCFVREKKLSFLHKKFQEFLAAIFLASCDNVQDVVKHITDFCSTLDTCLEMSQVWLFVSGIRPDITRQLLDHLTCIVTTDKNVKHYRQTLDGEGLIRAIQTCVTDCVIEGGNNGHIYDNIMLEDFYFDVVTTCHVERLLSCTPRSKVKSVYIHTRDIQTGDIDDSQLTSITGQLEQCHSVQKLHLYDPCSRIEISDTVAQIVNNNLDTLTCLDLYSHITATAELVSDICSISSKCLMALRLRDVRLTHEYIEQILTRLPQSPTIRQLELRLYCTDHGSQCKTARIDLSTMTHIQTLKLYFMSVDNLQSVSHCVEDVGLDRVILPVTTLCEFARRLSQIRRDVTVGLDLVTVTEVRERHIDMETFLRTCHGLKVTHCKYDDSDNTWTIDFTTSSQYNL